MNSGGFGGIDQHNRNVLPRTYCSGYLRSILLNRLDHTSSRWWDLVQAGKLPQVLAREQADDRYGITRMVMGILLSKLYVHYLHLSGVKLIP
jgi:hypothetical protein